MKKLIFTALLATAVAQAGVLGNSVDFDDVPETAAGDVFMVKPSKFSVNETVKRFTIIAKQKGFTIFTVIDHQKNAKNAGLKMGEEKVIIFGNPKGGTMLMNKDPRIGLDLPLKVLVYKDKGGVKLIYKKAQSLTRDYDVAGHIVLIKMANIMARFANYATKAAL